jgi:hypothetical protein
VTPQFVPGLEVSRRLFEEAVRPLLAECFPDLPYSAARIGSGSEVLGCDTERSTDHDWGARLQVFLRDDDVEPVAEPVRTVLSERLPTLIAGWAPWIEVSGVAGWFSRSLGFDPRAGVTTFDWLATPSQRLAEVTGGVDGSTRTYDGRPFQVLDAARFAVALRALISDEETRALGPIGGVDQVVDSTAVLTDPVRARAAFRGVLAG